MKYFSKDHTLFCKGIAILIMLFHHLFFTQDVLNKYFWKLSIHSHSLVQFIALQGKICVAIFVFLSAYGLSISYKKSMKKTENKMIMNAKFIFNKVKKLYLLYWPIFIVTILIGWLSNTRLPNQIYNSFGFFIRDFFGIAYIFDGQSPYIGAWWYISFALILYILFPIIYKLTKKYPKSILIITFCLGIKELTNVPIIIEIQRYIFIVCLGIYFAEFDLFEKIFNHVSNKKIFIISTFLCGIFFIMRCIRPFTFDAFFTVSIILLATSLFESMKWLRKVLIFLGKYSGNIFLIHGIIYKYWLFDFIYSFKIPILILLVLIVISLIISITIEYIKNIIGKIYNAIVSKKIYVNT